MGELAERRASILSAASGQIDNTIWEQPPERKSVEKEEAEFKSRFLKPHSRQSQSDTQSISGMSGISASSNLSSLSRLGAAGPPIGVGRQNSLSSGYSSRAASVFDGATPATRSPASSRARSVT